MSKLLKSAGVLLIAASFTMSFTGCGTTAKPNETAAVKANKSYSFWPPAPDEPHIQYLTSFSSSKDVGATGSNFEKMLYGAAADQVQAISKPYGVRMWNGRVYVCDIRGRGITVLDLRKNQTRVMGATGSNPIQKAVDLAISPDGVKYVLDQEKSSVLVYDQDERFYTAFPLPDCKLVGVAVFEDKLYVADFKHSHLKVLNRATGQLLRTIGEPGGEDGQFVGIVSVAVDHTGNLYVTDAFKARIQKFSPDGKFLIGWGQPGDRPGEFVRPKQLGVGSDGYIHVIDAGFYNVQVFDDQGRVVGYYGSPGSHPGSMDLPAGLDVHEGDLDLFQKYVHPAFEAERLILVTNQFGNQKVSVYAMGHLKPGKTAMDVAPGRANVTPGTTTQPVKDPLFTPRPAARASTTMPGAAATPQAAGR